MEEAQKKCGEHHREADLAVEEACRRASMFQAWEYLPEQQHTPPVLGIPSPLQSQRLQVKKDPRRRVVSQSACMDKDALASHPSHRDETRKISMSSGNPLPQGT